MGIDIQTPKTIKATIFASLFIAHVVGLIASVFIVDWNQAFFVMLGTSFAFTVLYILFAGCFITSLEAAQIDSLFIFSSLFFGLVDGVAIHFIYWKDRK